MRGLSGRRDPRGEVGDQTGAETANQTTNETGTTLVELMVSVVLLSVFSVAVAVVVTSGTAASADNRARISANGLGQRELDIVLEEIMAYDSAAATLRGEAINPNLAEEMKFEHLHPGGTDPNPDYPFKMDGEAYRVVRTVAPRTNTAGTSCLSAGTVVGDLGDTVTVSVTWASMGAGTAPHVVSEFVPRHREANTGEDPNKAIVGVQVSGQSVDGTTARAGIKVTISGPGATGGVQTTDSRGCAAFEVAPPPAGADYDVQLLGHDAAPHVTPLGQSQPVKKQTGVTPGSSALVAFTNYDHAARMMVTVVGVNESVQQVVLEPMFSGGGDTIYGAISGGTANFESLYPGSYVVRAGLSDPVAVTLAPGEYKTGVEVVIP
ncbi:MAG: hypothetical protein LBK95_02175 [Bifidobacteriaceae bacterium]|jgi:type II secretory pathway pseudopilin PulG|nr:hypothetical protein [Bifidobacteriaceae bacterium]